MEALGVLKFWKTYTAKVAAGTTPADCDGSEFAAFSDYPVVIRPVEDGDETDDDAKEVVLDEEDDSFFELELSLPGCNNSKLESVDSESNYSHHRHDDEKEFARIGDIVSFDSLTSPAGGDKSSKGSSTTTTRQKPQSPIAILRSAPKLRISMFGKFKKSRTVPAAGKSDTATTTTKPNNSQKQQKPKSNNLFTVKFRIEDASSVARKVSRTTSSKLAFSDSFSCKSDDLDASSRRFSKDSVQKYLNLIKKPLYVKVAASRRSSDRNSVFGTDMFNLAATPTTANSRSFPSPTMSSASAAAVPIASPRKSDERLSSRLRVPLKNLGKSRSGNALLGSPTAPPCRKEDSVAQQNDWIQGAIQHCKQSLQPSATDRSSLSRCSSDPSHEKSVSRETKQG